MSLSLCLEEGEQVEVVTEDVSLVTVRGNLVDWQAEEVRVEATEAASVSIVRWSSVTSTLRSPATSVLSLVLAIDINTDHPARVRVGNNDYLF